MIVFDTVEAAGDGRAAIEAAYRLNPDLIIQAIMLPVLDGFEVCKILRKEMTVPILKLKNFRRPVFFTYHRFQACPSFTPLTRIQMAITSSKGT